LTFATIAFGGAPASYPSGGVPLTAGELGMSNIDAVVILEANGAGINYEWDRSANTIRVFTTYGTEVSEGAYLSSTTLEVMAIGF
jgi:hypothetical protein